MSIWKAALLGVVQGITSVLPVGSSGHIALLGHLLGESSAYSLQFMVFLHLGTLFGVCWTFQTELRRLMAAFLNILLGAISNLTIFITTLFHPEKRKYQPIITGNYDRFVLLLTVSMGPMVAISLVIRRFAFAGAANLILTGMGFFVTALLFLISSYAVPTKKNPKMTKFKDAAVIGLLQGFSALPGVSRAGIVWSASRLSGLAPAYSFRYVYLLGIPSVIGSLVWVLPAAETSGETAPGVPACIIGIALATIVSAGVLEKVKRLLTRLSGRGFSVYSLIIGIICIVASFY